MAKQTKLEKNSPEIDAFKGERYAYNESSTIWTTYCRVTTQYGGYEISDTVEVWITSSRGVYEYVRLRGHSMDDEETDTVFSAKQATFNYRNETLMIEGLRRGTYYKVWIGEYDKDYVSKLNH